MPAAQVSRREAMVNLVWLFLSDALQVLLIGLIFGAGAPALFAMGIRALSFGAPDGLASADYRAHPLAKLVAVICFILVALAVVLGILIIVSDGLGLRVVFDWPLLQPK